VSGIVGIGGGIGASRLWRALVSAVDPARLSFVVNTADDLWLHGLRICPDIDTTMYALSGRQDVARGWGRLDETFRCMDALRELGHPVWFNLGDLDLATHLLRTGLLRDGLGLVEVTARMATALGVRGRVLPMTEDEVTTRVETQGGAVLHYEEYLVRWAAEPPVRAVHHDRLAEAQAAPGLLATIEEAELVILGPSNPLASVAPVLGLPGVRETLRRMADRVVAVSPIVSRVPISDPGERRRATSRAALLASIGVPATAAGVASLYRELCRRFVLDEADAEEAGAIRELGMTPLMVPTLLHGGAAPRGLLDAVLGVPR
jgi:LPPG:FO 2-phospho-L-lactate transferase